MNATKAPSIEQRALEAILQLPEWAGRTVHVELAAAPVISPLHRGVASDCVMVRAEGVEPMFLKLAHTDMQADIFSPAPAARLAAQAGVTPEILFEQPGVLGFDYLPPPWRYARSGDLQNPVLLGEVIKAKRRLHAGPKLGRRFCPFTRTEVLAAEAMACGVTLPDDIAHLLRAAALIREAVNAAGVDLAFCHNEAASSNVMLNGTQVLLVDFDIAGDNDPWYDIGGLINEVCDFDPARREAIEMAAGRYEETLFNRCRLYGAVDDLMWGLWALTRAITSPRTGIEFWKYGGWRLLHARSTIAARDFELWLRRL
jgi:hypothetical protein